MFSFGLQTLFKLNIKIKFMDTNEQKIRETLAYNIRVERAKKDISQKHLSDLAHISQCQIARIENCKVSPTTLTVLKIANALGVSVTDLIKKLINSEPYP